MTAKKPQTIDEAVGLTPEEREELTRDLQRMAALVRPCWARNP